MTPDTAQTALSLELFLPLTILLLAGQVRVTRVRADLANRRRQERQFTDSWAQDITLLVKVRRVYTILYMFYIIHYLPRYNNPRCVTKTLLPSLLTMAPACARLGSLVMMPQELYFHPLLDAQDTR